MTSNRTQKKTPSHSQKIKAEKERESGLDFHGDGLTEREERKYGLNPLSPDSDGDGLYDGQEIGLGSNPHSYSKIPPPVERDSDREKLRDAYLSHVQAILKAPDLSYATLYNQIAGEDWLGRSLDERVMALALNSGKSLEEAKGLIAQSPYVQWQLCEGQWHRNSAIHYARELASQFQLNREREEQISE
jgi:hypothetical protein